jgi:hypothetical protein
MSICIWVHAIFNFKTTSELTIEPLKAVMEEATKLLEQKREELASAQAGLSKTKVRLTAMKKAQQLLQDQLHEHDATVAQRQVRKTVAGGVASMLAAWKEEWAHTLPTAGSKQGVGESDRFQSNTPWCNLKVRVKPPPLRSQRKIV